MSTQYAENCISELLNFKLFWGSMPLDPQVKRGLTAPFVITAVYCLQQPVVKKLIETDAGNEQLWIFL